MNLLQLYFLLLKIGLSKYCLKLSFTILKSNYLKKHYHKELGYLKY